MVNSCQYNKTYKGIEVSELKEEDIPILLLFAASY